MPTTTTACFSASRTAGRTRPTPIERRSPSTRVTRALTTTSARFLERQQKIDAAAAAYRQAVDAQPTFRLARFNLGRMLIALSRPDDAIVELEKLTEPRDAEAPRYLFALATAHVRAGHREEGIKWATDAKQLAASHGQDRARRRHRARAGAAAMSRDPRLNAEHAEHAEKTFSLSNPQDRENAKKNMSLRALRALRSPLVIGAATAIAFGVFAAGAARRSSAAEPLFVESAASTGLMFTHFNGAAGQYHLPEMMGAGVALFDYDNDGDLDVFLVQSGAIDGSSPPGCRLFRNDLTVSPDGRRTLRFTDVTRQAGIAVRGYGMGAAVGDYDNDGYLDLFVTAFGPTTLLHNNGNGTFTDVTMQAGVGDGLANRSSRGDGPLSPAIASAGWSTSAAFVDYDRDGFLDLFVARYVDFTVAANKQCTDSVGARDYCGPRSYRPVADRLFHNDGHGRFVDVTERTGIAKADGAGARRLGRRLQR
jgi:hypothetical protein